MKTFVRNRNKENNEIFQNKQLGYIFTITIKFVIHDLQWSCVIRDFKSNLLWSLCVWSTVSVFIIGQKDPSSTSVCFVWLSDTDISAQQSLNCRWFMENAFRKHNNGGLSRGHATVHCTSLLCAIQVLVHFIVILFPLSLICWNRSLLP